MDYNQFFDKSDASQWHVACLNFARDSWNLYAVGYKKAADLLVQRLAENKHARSDLDTLVYPILFLYRQYLELRLKQLIIKLQRFLGDKSEVQITHRIEKLWKTLKALMERANQEIGNEEDLSQLFVQIEEYINIYSRLDPTSEAFRYPVTKDNAPSLPNESHISVGQLSFIINELSLVLDGASIQIDIWNNYLADFYSNYMGENPISDDNSDLTDDFNIYFE
jgi:hypothetical protein